jgi:rod shape-determining protein MreD
MSVLIQRISNTKMTVSIVIGLIISSFGLPGLSSSTAPDCLALIILYWAMLGGDHGPRLSTVFVLGMVVDFLGGQIVGIHTLKYLCLVALAVQFSSRFRMSARLNRTVFVVLTVLALEVISQGLVSLYVGASMDMGRLVAVAAWGMTWSLVEFILDKNYSRVDR